MSELRLYVAYHEGLYGSGATVAVAASKELAVKCINRELQAESLPLLSKENVENMEDFSLEDGTVRVVAGFEP